MSDTSGQYSYPLLRRKNLADLQDVATARTNLGLGSERHGWRNKIINGGLDIWQRGGGPFTTDTAITADRWTLRSTGSTQSISRVAFALGNVISGYEPTYQLQSTVTTSAGASNFAKLEQHIESVRTFAGQTATLSFWAKADASKSIGVEFGQNFGTGGSPSSPVDGFGVQAFALTTSWQRFSLTVNVPSISGKTLGTAGNDHIRVVFWMDAGSTYAARSSNIGQQSGTFYFWGVQLEEGSVATPFELRPPAMELALCQRYFARFDQNTSGHFCTSLNLNTTSTFGVIRMPVPMRAAPNLTANGAAADYGIYNSGMASVACTAKPTLAGAYTTNCLLQADSTGALVAGQANSIHVRNNTSLDFSAEL